MIRLALACFLTALPASALAQHGGHGPGGASPYAGQESRAVTSLSAEDIAELRRGGGWGLAKAAELNGVPGPAHLLELKAQIGLTGEQEAAIQAIFERMKSAAIEEGERLIALERALDGQFRSGAATDATLREALAPIEQSRRNLRYVHLSAHLTTLPVLTVAQLRRYNELRGYRADPCDNVPAGHDPVMWRRHNGCK